MFKKNSPERSAAISLIFLCIPLIAIGPQFACAQGTSFTRAFAPQEGLVASCEEPFRQEICLNGSWRFRGDSDTSIPGEIAPAPGIWDKTPIKIPSPWNVNSFEMEGNMPGGDFRAYPSYPQEWENLRAAWMERMITVPGSWRGKRLVLHFGAVAGEMVIYVNGHRVGQGFDIFFAQDFDVTKFIQPGSENQILVKVIKPEVFNKPGKYGRREYLSGSFWGTYIAGIWQDVFLEAMPQVHVADVFIEPMVDVGELRVEVTLANDSSAPADVELSGDIREWINQAGRSVLDAPEVKWKLAANSSLQIAGRHVTIRPGESQTLVLSAKADGKLKSWTPEAPNLYGLLLTLSVDGKPIDVRYERFGWRQFTLKGNQLCLNGEPIVLRGDSWHFMGVPQMTRRYAYGWYRLLKDAGANAVRLHASVYPSFYHDMADEMGIMILDESAIWASDGGPKADSDLFWSNCREHVAELVRRDRNHPSVFGWSICNEILPVLRNVWQTPQSMVDHCLDEISVWADICRTNDPTRGWISGDGEWDAGGRLPVINIHYGGDADLQRAADSGKPFAVGETSMAYYGTPKQVSRFNGNRAYESDLGRMEGLAYECYGLLMGQQKYGANYQSVFNIVWYGVQPLPLGKRDLGKPSSLDDGIFFRKYREGVPGMQPERLGPYVSTLNPGYDATLPLYRPWPMFEAIRDANRGAANSPWAKRSEIEAAIQPANFTNQEVATLSYVPGNGAHLVQQLDLAGVKPVEFSVPRKTDFLLVDGSDALDQSELKGAIDKTLSEGGTVWVWDANPAGAKVLSELLGAEITVGPRVASSFVIKHADPLLAGFDNASLYFSENDDWKQMSYGLSGPFVQAAQVLLEACPADWRKWNYKGEPIKTAALLRSELEQTSSRVAIVMRAVGSGRVILCNLDPQIESTRKAALVGRLFQNEGIPLSQVAQENEFVDFSGHLVRALACGSFAVADAHEAYQDKSAPAEVKAGADLNGVKWRVGQANRSGVFDFKTDLIRGPQENAFAYLAVWIKSPKPLNDLLAEPDLPRLSLTYGSDDGCQVWLNGELLATNERIGPLEPEAFSIKPLLLKLGWNQLVVKVVQAGGDWKFAGKFECSDPSFLQKLEFATEPKAGS